MLKKYKLSSSKYILFCICTLLSTIAVSQDEFARIYKEGPQNDRTHGLKIIDNKIYQVVHKACDTTTFCAALLCTDMIGDTLWYQDYKTLRPTRSIISEVDSSVFYWGKGLNTEGQLDEIVLHVDLDGSVINTFYLPIATDTIENYSSIRRDGEFLYLSTMQGVQPDPVARWFVIDKLNILTGVIEKSYSMLDTIQPLRNSLAKSALIFNDKFLQNFDFTDNTNENCPDGQIGREAHKIFVFDKKNLTLDTIIDRCFWTTSEYAFQKLNDTLFVNSPKEFDDILYDQAYLTFYNDKFKEVSRVLIEDEYIKGPTEILPIRHKREFIASGRKLYITESEYIIIPWVAKYNYEGELVWEHFYRDERTRNFNFLIPIDTSGSDLYFGGQFQVSYPDNPTSLDRALVKLDSMGCFNGDCGLFIELSNTVSTDPVLSNDLSIHVFPNPSFDRFHIRFEDLNAVSFYTLIDLKGLVLETTKITNDRLTIDATNYATGLYALIFYDHRGQVIGQRKLVKM